MIKNFFYPVYVLGDDVYPNGISNSLPEDIQKDFLRTIPGLEYAQIARYAYLIEYDYVNLRIVCVLFFKILQAAVVHQI